MGEDVSMLQPTTVGPGGPGITDVCGSGVEGPTAFIVRQFTFKLMALKFSLRLKSIVRPRWSSAHQQLASAGWQQRKDWS